MEALVGADVGVGILLVDMGEDFTEVALVLLLLDAMAVEAADVFGNDVATDNLGLFAMVVDVDADAAVPATVVDIPFIFILAFALAFAGEDDFLTTSKDESFAISREVAELTEDAVATNGWDEDEAEVVMVVDGSNGSSICTSNPTKPIFP